MCLGMGGLLTEPPPFPIYKGKPLKVLPSNSEAAVGFCFSTDLIANSNQLLFETMTQPIINDKL